MRTLLHYRAPSLAHPGEIRDVRLVRFRDVWDKMRAMRAMVVQSLFDPRIREVAAQVVQDAGVPPRDTMGQIGAILEHCQGLYYLGEGIETFSTPIYTLEHGFGDCDDNGAITISALLESIRIPTRFECIGWKDPLSGVYGDRHVYTRAGVPAGRPKKWVGLEATIPGSPVGFEPAEHARELLARACASL